MGIRENMKASSKSTTLYTWHENCEPSRGRSRSSNSGGKRSNRLRLWRSMIKKLAWSHPPLTPPPVTSPKCRPPTVLVQEPRADPVWPWRGADPAHRSSGPRRACVNNILKASLCFIPFMPPACHGIHIRHPNRNLFPALPLIFSATLFPPPPPPFIQSLFQSFHRAPCASELGAISLCRPGIS